MHVEVVFQAYELGWITVKSSIYAQLNGAVQHPHSVATSQHLRNVFVIFFISKLRRKEALKNEMPVALVITNNKGTVSHHVNKTETKKQNKTKQKHPHQTK